MPVVPIISPLTSGTEPPPAAAANPHLEPILDSLEPQSALQKKYVNKLVKMYGYVFFNKKYNQMTLRLVREPEILGSSHQDLMAVELEEAQKVLHIRREVLGHEWCPDVTNVKKVFSAEPPIPSNDPSGEEKGNKKEVNETKITVKTQPLILLDRPRIYSSDTALTESSDEETQHAAEVNSDLDPSRLKPQSEPFINPLFSDSDNVISDANEESDNNSVKDLASELKVAQAGCEPKSILLPSSKRSLKEVYDDDIDSSDFGDAFDDDFSDFEPQVSKHQKQEAQATKDPVQYVETPYSPDWPSGDESERNDHDDAEAVTALLNDQDNMQAPGNLRSDANFGPSINSNTQHIVPARLETHDATKSIDDALRLDDEVGFVDDALSSDAEVGFVGDALSSDGEVEFIDDALNQGAEAIFVDNALESDSEVELISLEGDEMEVEELEETKSENIVKEAQQQETQQESISQFQFTQELERSRKANKIEISHDSGFGSGLESDTEPEATRIRPRPGSASYDRLMYCVRMFINKSPNHRATETDIISHSLFMTYSGYILQYDWKTVKQKLPVTSCVRQGQNGTPETHVDIMRCILQEMVKWGFILVIPKSKLKSTTEGDNNVVISTTYEGIGRWNLAPSVMKVVENKSARFIALNNVVAVVGQDRYLRGHYVSPRLIEEMVDELLGEHSDVWRANRKQHKWTRYGR